MTEVEIQKWYEELERETLTIVPIRVYGGCCTLKFLPGTSTGPAGSQSNPGISFTFIADNDRLIKMKDGSGYMAGMGVIGRNDAKKLAEMIFKFLDKYETESLGEQK